MKHTLIKTEDYLLVVSDEPITLDTKWYYDTHLKDVRSTGGAQYGENSITKKVLAHLPLNDAGHLAGLDVLPEIDYDLHINDAIGYAGSEGHPDPHAFSEKQIGLLHGYVEGFEKAKETYKHTEEDLRKAFQAGEARWGTNGLIDSEPNEDEFIQSINQPKLPVAFECYVDNILSHNADAGADADALVNPNFGKPKTFTNSEGRTEWFGKYLFN
jgi:hypothetical protein